MDCVFERVENIDSLSPDDFLERFERYGFLWFKAKGSKSSAEKMPTGNQILDFVNDHASACEASWTIENYSKGAPLKEKINPQNLSDFTGTNTSFYASTIVHRKPDNLLSPAYQKLSQLLPKYETVFEDIHDNGDPSGTWLFFGHHGKKRKRRAGNNEEAISSTLHGRAEHVDEVTHSGTYHFQVSGTKTWKIRPHPDSLLAEELKQQESGGRIKITVEEGDVFALNTKIWYHCTELNFMPSSSSEWSISVAQDFYLPVPCPKDVKQGDVVYGYDYKQIDDVDNESRGDQEIPDELARSDDPNCVLVEVDVNDDHDSVDESNDESNDVNDNDHESIQTRVALVALRDITEGENLTIAFDPEGEQLGNANEQIDPRVIARQNWNKNEIVIQGEDRLPQDIPRSYEPNCVLVEVDNGVLALRALEDIPEGAVYCVMPDEDEDYDEVEVEFGTGELVQQA